ncbi:MAG: hypothetical protein WCI18_14130 [Pseudomonadota bacterium]
MSHWKKEKVKKKYRKTKKTRMGYAIKISDERQRLDKKCCISGRGNFSPRFIPLIAISSENVKTTAVKSSKRKKMSLFLIGLANEDSMKKRTPIYRTSDKNPTGTP